MLEPLTFGPLQFTSHTAVEAVELVVRHSKGHDVTALSVVTPNIQHVYLANKDESIATSLNSADIILPDGWPLAAALRHFHSDRRGRVPGSDLTEIILKSAHASGLRIAILGGTPASNKLAVERTQSRFPGLAVSGSGQLNLPPVPTDASRAAFVSQVNEFGADITLVCFGAPKSELHVAECKNYTTTGALLCVGATVDFLAGTKARAPRWVQNARLEWAFRVLQEPRRLTLRYIQGFTGFAAAWRATSRNRRSAAA